MPYQAAPRVAQVEVRGIFDDVPVENVYHFQRSSDIDQEGLDALTYTMNAYVLSTLAPDYPDALSVNEVYAADLTTPDGLQSTNANDMPVTGGLTDDAMPPNVTLCISLRTAFRGRSRRGRHYWLGLTKPSVDNKLVTSTATAVLLADLQGLVGANALLAGWTWGVLSRWQDKELRDEALFTPITAITVVDRRVDSQRGRLK